MPPRRKSPAAVADPQTPGFVLAAASPRGAGHRLITSTGVCGSLLIAPDVVAEAHCRGVDVDAMPMDDACRLILELEEPGGIPFHVISLRIRSTVDIAGESEW
jgi:hypothetical protein